MALCSNRVEASPDGQKSSRTGGSGKLSGVSAEEAAAAAKEKLLALMRGAQTGDDFLNFNPDAEMPSWRRFLEDVKDTLLFGELIKSIRIAAKRSKYYSLPFRFVDAMIQWFSFIFIMFFPAYLVLAAWLNLACY